ncbi:hypothetical protein ACXYRK_00515 [Mycoplasma sp. AC1221]
MSLMQHLEYNNFVISKNFNISTDDLHNLRQFYGSFLGPEGVCLYEYLLDLAGGQDYSVVEYDFSTLAIFINIHETQLQSARVRLEGAGLINTYKDNKKALTIFEIQKPLTPENIQRNTFLTNLIVSKIGKINFDKFIKSRRQKIVSSYEFNYEDITSDFFSVFSTVNQTESEQIERKLIMNQGATLISDQEIKVYTKKHNLPIPLEIGNVQYSNAYEAILKLTPQAFFKQLSNEEISSADEISLKTWTDRIPESKCLNLIMYIARLKYKSDKWHKHIWTMILEISSQNLFKFEDIEKYLDGKLKIDKRYTHIFEQKTVLKQDFLTRKTS